MTVHKLVSPESGNLAVMRLDAIDPDGVDYEVLYSASMICLNIIFPLLTV